jgi:hypothetical protein
MSGGIAYVYDPDGTFKDRCNPSMVALERVLPEAEQAQEERELAAAGKAIARHLDRADDAILRELCESTCASPARASRSRCSTTGTRRDRSSSRCSRRVPPRARRARGARGREGRAGEAEGRRVMGKITGFLELERVAEVAEARATACAITASSC